MSIFSNEFLVKKDSIDFLDPFIIKAETLGQQIPDIEAISVPQYLSLETFEKKI